MLRTWDWGSTGNMTLHGRDVRMVLDGMWLRCEGGISNDGECEMDVWCRD